MIASSNKKFMSDINVTPLVDVMLVLLIIFMVTAPMMKHGMDVNLPKTEAKVIPGEDERLIITVTTDNKVYIDDFETDMASFRNKLEHIFQTRPNKEAFLRADETIQYGFVAQVLAQIREAGVTKVGMITEPYTTKKK